MISISHVVFFIQVDIKSNSLFHNRISILKMAHERMLGKLRKPVDKEEYVCLLFSFCFVFAFPDSLFALKERLMSDVLIFPQVAYGSTNYQRNV